MQIAATLPFNQVALFQFDRLAGALQDMRAAATLAADHRTASITPEQGIRAGYEARALGEVAIEQLEAAHDVPGHGRAGFDDIAVRGEVYDVVYAARWVQRDDITQLGRARGFGMVETQAREAIDVLRTAADAAWASVGAMYGTGPDAERHRAAYYAAAIAG
jgi:hypothetical protein